MAEPVFASDRTFQVWSYTVSHRELLLRSVKDEHHDTRLDLLFKPVRRVELDTMIKGMNVVVEDGCFVLFGDGWSGIVDAETFASEEDDGEYDDPSRLAQ